MSKLRRLMNRLSHGALTSVAALALTVTATNMNRCCWFIFGQDKLPDNACLLYTSPSPRDCS